MRKLITLTIMAFICHFTSFAQCPITGSTSSCVGATAYVYVDSTTCAGGTWSSSNPYVASVGTTGGTYGSYTGISGGTAIISYTLSGITTTLAVTIYPSPASISGATTVCDGSTIVLTDATPGGTWSSSISSYATVGASTGVVTGVHRGNAYIYYTVPGGCYSSVMVTVTSSFDSSADTILGHTYVCPGSVDTLTCGTPGGTWSSSVTGIATVSSGGLVVGMATGVAYISYTVTGACGTASIELPVTVNPTVSAGYLSGTGYTNVGGTFTLADYLATGTGTWTNPHPDIATISSSGLVYGVSPGLDSIGYVVTGCGTTTDTAFAPVTINALNGISGYVIMDTPFYGYITVWLIKFNPSTDSLVAIDSQSAYIFGTSRNYYSFAGLGSTDSFRVKAAISVDSMSGSTGYVPTYHDSAYHWNTCNVINFVSGASDTGENIYMNRGIATSGPGFIGGSVLSGADKGTSGGVPVVGMLVYVYNSTTGRELQHTKTDASGNYMFSNLPVGATYYIYPEAINYVTTIYPDINLTSTTPGMTVADFKQHTVSKTITPILEGVNNVSSSASTIGVYPNPTSGKVSLIWNEAITEKATVSVCDMTGRTMMQQTMEMKSGAGSMQMDLCSLEGGLYIISVKSGTINYNSTINLSK